MHDGSTFSISEPINGEPVTVANGSTIGFTCNSPEQIQEFHDVAIANGGTSVEAPPGVVKVIWVRCTCATFLIQTAIKFAAFIGLAEPKHNGSHTAYGPNVFLLGFVETRGY